MIKTIVLIFASICFVVVIGGAVYEHLAVVPVWSSAVPASLTMFRGEYGIASGRFWIPIHPVTLGLLLLALIINWRTGRKCFILITIGGYLLVLVLTAFFFVPELMAITQTPYANSIDVELTRRANNWELLSLIRLGFLIILAVTLLFGLSKPVGVRRQF